MRTNLSQAGRLRPGFTLVEVLVVIVILALLAALLVGGVLVAKVFAKGAVIRSEISQLEAALEKYKQEYGEYPPDFTNHAVAVSHIRKRFPRYTLPTDLTSTPPYVSPTYSTLADAQWAKFSDDVAMATTSGTVQLRANNFGPANALVFWLGGLPDDTDATNLTGFSANPANPFESSTTASSRIAPLFVFRAGQLTTSNNTLQYHPASLTQPYAYFRASAGAYNVPSNPPKPYYNSTKSAWVNAKTYQIISAGIDDGYGTITTPLPNPAAPHFPAGDNFDESDTATNQFGSHYDNITNFTSSTIEAEMKQ